MVQLIQVHITSRDPLYLQGNGLVSHISKAWQASERGQEVKLYKPKIAAVNPDSKVYFLTSEAYELAREFLSKSEWSVSGPISVDATSLEKIDL